MGKIKIEVDLPVLNEEKQLKPNVEKVRQFLKKNMSEYEWQIVIVDNGSNDRTHTICKKLKKQYKDVDFIRLPKRGRGRALRKAWTESNSDICSYMDIDLSTDLRAYPKLINAIVKKKYDIATGSRLMKGAKIKRSIKREILSRGYIFLLKNFLGFTFKDAQCGFKAVNRKVIKEVLPHVLDQEWFFDSELLFKCQKWGYRIKEIPVRWVEDPDSKVKLYQTVKNYLLSILRIKLEFTQSIACTQMIKKIIHRLCSNPVMSNLIRNIIEAGMITVKSNIKKEIRNTKNKKIIDIACGTGQFSVLAKGEYVGIDLNKRHIMYARKKYGSKKKKFLIIDANSLAYPDKYFDYAFMLGFLHHIPEVTIGKVLTVARRITKEKIIIIDLVPLKYNLLGKFLYKIDQGKFIRPYEEQLRLVRKYTKLKNAKIFRSGMDLHSLIVCETE
ncbi:MAG: glycosyltransferase [Candidatus Aminicenantaceae bacterium]